MAAEAIPITARARRRRAIVDHFCASHAITPYDTILYRPTEPLRAAFEAMLAERLIRREGHAYYWLDLTAWEAAVVQRRRRLVPVVIAAAVAVAMALMLLYRG